jgi:hypothetical protein
VSSVSELELDCRSATELIFDPYFDDSAMRLW